MTHGTPGRLRHNRRKARESTRKRIGKRRSALIEQRDGGRCVYCGSAENVHIDHHIPRSRGGTDALSNLLLCCRRCNCSKQDKTPRQWYRYLRAQGQETTAMVRRVRRRLDTNLTDA